MQWLKQSTAITLKIGPFLDETDGKTAETGLTIAQADVRLSKNGANIAQKNEATSCTHDELGIYGCPIDTTDTATLGRLQLWVHEAGALPVWHEFMVVPANVWDSMFGADMLKVDVHAIDDDETAADNLESYCDGTTPIPANATQISDDATAADNLELITEISNITSLTIDAAGHLECDVVEIEGADPTDTIRDAVVDDATRIDASALNTLSGHDPGGTLCADATPLTAAETESEVNDALVALKLDHLVAVAESDDPVDNSIIAKMAASDGDWSGFGAATESLEALRDRGDAAWITAPNDLSAAQVNAEVDTALADIHLDHLLAADYDPASKPGTATALLNELVENDGGVSRFTANALEEAPTGGSAPTVGEIADAVWDEAIADHAGAGSTGAALAAATAPSAATVADAVWDEATADHTGAGSTGAAIAASAGAGTGSETFTYTLTSTVGGTPVANAAVWVTTTNHPKNNIVASGTTDNIGEVTFYLDPGTYYVWREKSGWNFTNPDTETVA